MHFSRYLSYSPFRGMPLAKLGHAECRFFAAVYIIFVSCAGMFAVKLGNAESLRFCCVRYSRFLGMSPVTLGNAEIDLLDFYACYFRFLGF